MSITFPDGVEGEGNVKAAFLSAITDPAAPSLAGDFGTEVDLSCYIVGDGFAPGGSQESKSDRRLCSRQIFTTPGAISYEINELTYVYDPQDPDDSSGENEMFNALAPDTAGYIIVRFGLPYDQAFAEGDVIDVYQIVMGAQFKNPPVLGDQGGGAGSSKLTVRQTPYVVAPPELDVAIVT